METILADHRTWLESHGAKGAQAVLDDQDLTAADLKGAELSRAQLNRVNLKGCDLSGTLLRGASLNKACLEDTHLEGTVLRDASLADASLLGSTGLLGGQLAGTSVSGARLPDAISKFDAFTVVVDGSKSFHTLMLSVVAAVAYCVLTIGSTRDGHLLANSGLTQLPVIGTQTPIANFFWIGPGLLLGLYCYYLVTAQRLWELLAEMPAVFPDGRALDKRLNSLLLSAFLHACFPQLMGRRPPLSWLQEKLSILISWWLVPLTLGLFWIRYLRRHDWAGTSWHMLTIVVAVGAGLGFYRLAKATLAADDVALARFRHPLRHLESYLLLAPALLLGALLLLLSVGAIEGIPSGGIHGTTVHTELGYFDPRRWLPKLYEGLDLDASADLQGSDLSQKPAGWNDDVRHVQGAYLRGRHLDHARASGAFIANADLRGACLEGANLFTADLRQADLREADLRFVDLERARLDEASFVEANLTRAKMAGAEAAGADFKSALMPYVQLQRARLAGARLTRADLSYADLVMADLRGADLTDANLNGAHLQGADLRDVTGLTQAQLGPAHTNAQTQVPAGLQVDGGPEVTPGRQWRH